MAQEELKALIIERFSNIEQIATDRKTPNGYVMNYQGCLEKIRRIAKDTREFVDKHFEINGTITKENNESI